MILAYARAHLVQPLPRDISVETDPIKALASLRLDAISFVGRSSTAYPNILTTSDLENTTRQEAITIFLGDDWLIGLVLQDGRIWRMRLLGQIPPPF